MDYEFEEYYLLVCYDLHNMGVDPNLASKDNIQQALYNSLEANAAACIEFERIKSIENPLIDFD